MITVVLAAVALVVLALTVVMKPHHRLYVAAFLAVPQVHLPGFPASIFQMWMIIILVLTFIEPSNRSPIRRIEIPVGLLAIVTFLYVFVSAQPTSALLIGSQLLAFLAFLRLGHAVGVESRHIYRAASLVAFWVVVEALMAIAFHLRPAWEIDFMRTLLADVFVGPSAQALFTTGPNNVLDPLKAGGLFVNGNVASMFLGTAALVFVAVALHFRRAWAGWVAALAALGVLATGSKTGLLLLILLPIAAALLVVASGRAGVLAAAALLPALVAVGLAIPPFLSTRFPQYFSELDASAADRAPLWRAAWQLFGEQPLVGLGYGNWAEHAEAAVGRTIPPHNLLLASWVNTGIVGLILTIAIITTVTVAGAVALARTAERRQRATIACALVATWWVFLHGMADNTTVYGEMKSMVLVALAIMLMDLPAREPETDDPKLSRRRVSGTQPPARYPPARKPL
ncbi:O-antigen ligase family protein [Demequina aurantiaca]|uniref:O-antigen ligase family protein n=1 Tax=Demequina aurantiaca TaxID=676200 RepID=UPI003D355E45